MIGSQFNYYDLSQITEIEDVEVSNDAPTVLACFGADKGTEEFFKLSGKDFVKMFGDPSYKNYGQVSVQTRRAIDNGAIVIGKRVVADDAKLAHTIIFAETYVTRDWKLDAEGKKMYITPDGTEVGIATGEIVPSDYVPLLNSTVTISYKQGTVSGGVTTPDQIHDAMEKPVSGWPTTKIVDDEKTAAAKALDPQAPEVYVQTLDEEGNLTDIVVTNYPIFAVYDCGRGKSSKRFRLTPEYKLSKNLPFMYYTLTAIEDGDEIDDVTFAMVPDTIVNRVCIDMNSVSNSDLKLVKAYQNEDAFKNFVVDLADNTGISVDDLLANDAIFGCNRKGNAYANIVISEDSIDLQNVTGQDLKDGNNGSWGDYPASDIAQRDAYYGAIEKFYAGKITEDIYDLDSFQIDACFDAAFPVGVKSEIAKLCEYRKDFMYFRDYSTPETSKIGVKSVSTIDDIKAIREDEINYPHSTRITDYALAWDVIDIYSKKQISVSCMYSLIPLVIAKLKTAREIPMAGQRNDAIIDEIVYGTLNYKPRTTPEVNEKDELEDLRVNFGSYYKNDFVLESIYTSQDDYTQLSFNNNVMALQEVIKALRAFFPAIRYAFITGDEDIAQITSQINSMLEGYSSGFEELKFEYVGDSKHIANKIYKAKLSFRFNNFIQAEIIDAYALPSNM